MERRKFLLATGAASGIAFAGCAGPDDDETGGVEEDDPGNGEEATDDPDERGEPGDDEGEEQEEDSEEDAEDAVTIHEHEMVEDFGGNAEIEGEAENTSGEEQSYIEIGATFFDEDDTRIDDSFTNESDVPDGQVFTFEIMTTTDYEEVDRYELEWSLSP